MCTWIGEYSCATERALKNADGCEHEAWAYLHERHLRRAVRLQRILFDYLPSTISIRGSSAKIGSCLTWKLRNHILESRIENVRTWSMKRLALRACGGTPNICFPPGTEHLYLSSTCLPRHV